MKTIHAWYAVTFGSAALLAAAYAFQHVGGLHPCELCLWQRWPHFVAVPIALLYYFRPTLILALAGALAMFASLAIAIFHSGVELQLWSGLSGCTGPALTEMSGEQLLDLSIPETVARCDEVAWSFLGISMAGWNGILSAILMGMWIWLARHATKTGFRA